MKEKDTLGRFMIRSLTVFFLLPVLVLWITFFLASAGIVKENSINEQLTVTNTVNYSVEMTLLEMEGVLNVIKTNADVLEIIEEGDLDRYDSSLYNAHKTLDRISNEVMWKNDTAYNVILLDNEDGMYCRWIIPKALEMYLFSDAYHQVLLEGKGNPVVLSGWKDVQDRDILLMAIPIIDTDRMKAAGSVCLLMKVEDLEYTIGKFGYEDDILTIMDGFSGLVYCRKPAEKSVWASAVQENRESFESEHHGEMLLNGKRMMYFCSDENRYALRTVSFVSIAEMNRELVARQMMSAGIMVAVIALVSALVWYVYRKIRRNLEKIYTGTKSADDVEYYELKQINDRLTSLKVKNREGEERIVKLVNRCDTVTLDKLQAQINPHFLYNTLNSIKYMAILEGQKKIGDMITALVRLLRSTINRSGHFVLVSEEMKSIESYMFIQNSIYEGNIDFVMKVQDGMEMLYIPNFILQPLLENCIFHGIHPETAGGQIRVNGFLQDGYVVFEVADNGDGFEPQFIERIFAAGDGANDRKNLTNFGLKGVQDKIRLLCGDEYGLSIRSDKSAGSQVRVTLPVKKQPDDNP